MTDPFRKPESNSDPATDNEPEIVTGEVVDDEAAGPFRGDDAGPSGFTGRSPFTEPDPFGDQQPLGGSRSSARFGVGGVGGSFAALRAMAGNSAEIRDMVTTPLRLLAIVVAVPAVVAALFGLTIDGSARYMAFVIAAIGLVVAGMLEARRRRLAAVPAPRRAGDPAPSQNRTAGRLIGLIAFAVLITMLAIGFDLLALALVLFGVW